MKTMRMLALAAALGATTVLPAAGTAQTDVLDLGVHAVRADHLLDGSTGIGGQVALNIPGFPLSLRGAVDRFFPDCPQGSADDCAAWGFTVDGNLTLPVPVLSPYLSAGVVRRSVDPGDPLVETSETGMALGGGVRLALFGLDLFGEARRELMSELDDTWMFRAGLVF